MALVLIAAIGWSGCGGDDNSSRPETSPAAGANREGLDGGEAQAPTSGHARMVAALRAIAAATDEEDIYQGTARARSLAVERERLGDGAGWNLYMESGIAELRAGAEREGLELLEVAYAKAAALPERVRQEALNQVRFHLGVGHLRLAETENCCADPSPYSCILPFAAAAEHQHPEGAEGAIRYLSEMLEHTPEGARLHFGARWLLNLAYLALGRHPDAVPPAYLIPAEAFESRVPFPRFDNVAAALGVDTFSLSGGAIADDFDGDGILDLVVSSWDRNAALRYFRGSPKGFVERSAAAGFDGILGGLNLVQADYDNDGDLDILVLRGAWLFDRGRVPNSLLRNNGDGTFVDVTFAAGLGDEHFPTQTAGWADYNNDGLLDLYIGNESSSRGRYPSQLFRNEGDGTFRDVTTQAGVKNLAFAKAVTWGDFDGDGWPDLYVSNNGQPNRLYHNQGDGTFVDVAERLQVVDPLTSFPAWFFDYDNDGVLDLFVSSYSTDISHHGAHLLGVSLDYPPARLYRGDGEGGFVDQAQEVGLGAPLMPMGSNFGDLNGDGLLDIYLGTGNVHYYSLMPNALFVSGTDGGARFEDVTMASGFGHLQKGHGVAFADFNHDGALDVFAQIGGAYRGDGFRDALWRNPGFGHRHLTVHLVGVRTNRCAIGARIRVRCLDAAGAETSVYRHVNSGGSFGANPLRQTIGLGDATEVVAVEVYWPTTGETQVVDGIELDSALRIVEGADDFEVLDLPTWPLAGEQKD